MKLSKYNFIYTNKLLKSDDTIIYNSRTGALATLEPKLYAQLLGYKTNSLNRSSEFERKLLDCGFIVDDDVNELKLVKYNLFIQRFNNSHMTLTIAPTMACNFRCSYCFEKNQYHDIFMSETTISKLIDFVNSMAKGLKKLTVLWFGGEPLLALDQINLITVRLLDLCSKNNIAYEAGINTNGYLINKETAYLLRSYSITNLCITIDGTKPIHDSRRYLINGSGTFDTILGNILETCEIIPINIRVNLDKHNIANLSNLMTHFGEKGILNNSNINISLAPVQNFNNDYDNDYCLTDELFSKLQLQFVLKHHLTLNVLYPLPKGCYCQADHYNSFCIDPHGDLYKCLSDIGIASRKISSVYNTNICNYDLFDNYMLFDATTDEKCSKCKFLPICMGGCPFFRIRNLNSCDYRKYNFENYICEYAISNTENK